MSSEISFSDNVSAEKGSSCFIVFCFLRFFIEKFSNVFVYFGN